MNVASIQNDFAENNLWRNLSCNWIWGAVLFFCCLLMSMNAASSNAPQHAYPLIQTVPQPPTSVIARPQIQRDLRPVRPQSLPLKKPEEKRAELDGVT